MTFKTALLPAQELWEGFLHLLYPELCIACGNDLPVAGGCFCLSCQLKTVAADMYRSRENEFTNRFWGRMEIEGGAAMFFFTRKSPVQRALHQLKYHNKPEIGVKLGREFGRKLKSSETFRSADAIVPVPLHPKKERLRGYNQSAMFAQGISEVMEIPVLYKALSREVFTETQTRKKRMERFENVGDVFTVRSKNLLENKHILLVDDVLTTGATLETCGQAILALRGTRLSLATIAIAVTH